MLRVGLGTDAATMDPHAVNAGSTTLVLRQIYEPLVGRDQDFARAPGLALEWSTPEPNRWRFRLRPNVRFHDGSTFDADDVVFSLERSRTGFSDFKIYTSSVLAVHKIDALTVDFVTDGADPILPDKLSRVFIVDRDWAIRHGTERAQDFGRREGSYAAMHANGTGPYRLRLREPDGRTELERHDAWWGQNSSPITAVRFMPITSDGPRVASLLAGDTDLVLDVPPQLVERIRQSPRLRVVERPENRTLFLGLDQARDELVHGDVKTKNPLKDVRVRQAMSLAIDREAIRRSLMQGYSSPAGLMWAPGVFGHAAEDDVPLPVDLDRARRLMEDSGYRSGFAVTLDCPRDRYINDEQICQALASQLSRIGIRITVNVMPFNLFVGKLRRYDTSLYLLGWATPTYDPHVTLQALIHTRRSGPDGSNNFGGYSNPALDALTDQIRSEMDLARRAQLLRQAGRLHRDDVGHIPLHHQMLIWAMRADIDPVQPPENQLDVALIRLRR